MRSTRCNALDGVHVSKDELWVLLITNLRYSFTRRSYMPGLAMDLYRKYRSHLTVDQRRQVAEEIRSELKVAAEIVGWMGYPDQMRAWEALATEIELELQQEAVRLGSEQLADEIRGELKISRLRQEDVQ